MKLHRPSSAYLKSSIAENIGFPFCLDCGIIITTHLRVPCDAQMYPLSSSITELEDVLYWVRHLREIHTGRSQICYEDMQRTVEIQLTKIIETLKQEKK